MVNDDCDYNLSVKLYHNYICILILIVIICHLVYIIIIYGIMIIKMKFYQLKKYNEYIYMTTLLLCLTYFSYNKL